MLCSLSWMSQCRAVCPEELVPFLICMKVPYGLLVALRRTSNCAKAFVLFYLDVLAVGITSSWPELSSQGVYHGLSAKKMGSYLPEGTQRTGMWTGSGRR